MTEIYRRHAPDRFRAIMIRDSLLDQAIARLRGYPRRWAVAGGWAIDLFIGRATRPHGDVDIATLRVDQSSLRELLRDATVAEASNGTLVEWRRDQTLVLPTHEIHARWPNGSTTEFLLNESDGQNWRFRRDPRIRLAFDRVFLEWDGVPYLAPEVALLYKSNDLSSPNETDFRNAVALMGLDQATWLRNALELTAPSHEWIGRLPYSQVLTTRAGAICAICAPGV